MAEYIGYTMVLSPFIAMFLFASRSIGIKDTFFAFLLTGVVAFLVYAGCFLIDNPNILQ